MSLRRSLPSMIDPFAADEILSSNLRGSPFLEEEGCPDGRAAYQYLISFGTSHESHCICLRPFTRSVRRYRLPRAGVGFKARGRGPRSPSPLRCCRLAAMPKGIARKRFFHDIRSSSCAPSLCSHYESQEWRWSRTCSWQTRASRFRYCRRRIPEVTPLPPA